MASPPIPDPRSPSPPEDFALSFTHIGVLKRALSVLSRTTFPANLGLAAAAGGDPNVVVDLFADSTSDPPRVFVVATCPPPLPVRVCLDLEVSGDFGLQEDRGVRFRLGDLVAAIDRAVGNGDGAGLTLSIKERNERELVCSLTIGQGEPVESVVIPFIPIPMDDWQQLKANFTLSFRIPVEQWNRMRDWNEAPAPVNIKVTLKTVEFFENNPNKKTIKLRRQRTKWADMYTLEHEPAGYPVIMQFSFSPRIAILNAVQLAEDVHNQIPGNVQQAQEVNNQNPGDVPLPQQVWFHCTPDHQCCLDIPVNGLGSIYFRS